MMLKLFPVQKFFLQMNKHNIIYSILIIALFFMASISLLSLQNNDIKIVQQKKTVTLNLKHKFNLNLAVKKNNKNSLLSN